MIKLDANGEFDEVRIADFLRGPLMAPFEDVEPAYAALMALQRRCARRFGILRATIRAIQAIGELLRFAEAHGPSKVRIVATSAVRDAANKEIFQAEVKKATGWPLQILNEREEALLIGRGISSDPGLPDRRSFCAIDLGGGSMEYIHYKDGRMERGVSLPLGAVRFTRNLASDGKLPISDLEAESIRKQVTGHLERSSLTGSPNGLLVGCGGAFSVSRAIFADRSGQSDEETSPTLRVSHLQQLYEEIRRIPLAERCEISQLPNGRADILPAALQILLTVAEHFDCKNYHHSHYNLRFGLAATLRP